jgi:hypothetical protein
VGGRAYLRGGGLAESRISRFHPALVPAASAERVHRARKGKKTAARSERHKAVPHTGIVSRRDLAARHVTALYSFLVTSLAQLSLPRDGPF